MFEQIKSYGVVLEVLEQGECTIHKILDRLLEEDLPSSEATFSRIKRNLKAYFGCKITYKKPYYELEKLDNPNQRLLFQYIHLIKEAEVFQEVLANPEDRDKVLVDDITGLKFQDLLGDIFAAIKQKTKLSFSYYHFDERADRQIKLRPYVLKQHEKRWYVTGYDEDAKEVRTFGLDRISELLTTYDTFQFKDYHHIAKTYEETYGLNYSNEITRIRLKAFKPQYEYLERVPLHTSQKLRDSNQSEHWVFEYKLRPNYEFEMALLRLSHQIEVEEPVWLRENIRNKLQLALKRHQ